MNAAELRRYIADVEALGYGTQGDRVSLAAKAAFPLTALIMTLLGLPFAFSMGKRGTLVGSASRSRSPWSIGFSIGFS